MKKLLLTIVVMMCVVQDASACENKDNSSSQGKASIIILQDEKITVVKNFSNFYDELQKEFIESNDYSFEEVGRLEQQKNHLKRKVRESTFPLIDQLFLIPHIPYLRGLDSKISSTTEKRSSDGKLYTSLQVSVMKLQREDARNSYAKKVTLDDIKILNDKDNDRYYEDLLLLEATKTVMEHNLRNVSWFQWLWDYRACRNYQESIQTLNDEITLFKDQDRVVSPSGITKGLTHREVFTRSCMPRSSFEQLKAARE